MVARRVRALIADPNRPGSLSARARRRRWATLTEAFPELSSMSVLDLGGTVEFWADAAIRPAKLTLLNPGIPDASPLPWAEALRGDACDPPAAIGTRSFDLVYSNSTIEHVGGHARRRLFADTVHRLGSHLWVQTPYRYFPIEPHFVFPWFQHLPVSARTAIATRWPLSPPQFPTDRVSAREEVMSIELLSITEMRDYFPEAELRLERSGGLVKSLIAVH